MDEIINAHTAGCYEQAIALLDQEFVYGKGRTLSLAARMPGAYGPANSASIYCLLARGQIASIVVAQPLAYWYNQIKFLGYMIGGVYTAPEVRGQGLASRLVSDVERQLWEQGSDFLVLWTGIRTFYERLGWRQKDASLFGRLSLITRKEHKGHVSVAPIARPWDINILDNLRRAQQASYVVRSLENQSDYYNIPLPAERTELWLATSSAGPVGYSLVGSIGKTCYLYEQWGNLDTITATMMALDTRYTETYINESATNPAYNLYNLIGQVEWNAQDKAMWKVRSSHLCEEEINALYIPYLDRI